MISFVFFELFLCCCWGACSSFLLLFSVPALSGSCFSSFFFVVFCSFLPSGRGVVLFFFPPLLLGLVFVCFFLFLGVFSSFFFSKGLVLFVGPFLGLFWGPGGL